MKTKTACRVRIGGPSEIRDGGRWLRTPKAARHAAKALKRLGIECYVAKMQVSKCTKLRGEAI